MVADLVTDANAVRPVTAGGTGGATAAAARTALAVPGLATENVFTKTQIWAKGADVASDAALPILDDGNYFDVTGTNAITSIPTVGIGAVIKLHFDGILTLTHHSTDLVLPGAANITTAAGDEAEFVEYATGDWRCTNYQRGTGWVTFQSGNISNQSELVITGFPSSAKIVEIYLDSVSPVTDANNLRMRTSTDAAMTFDSGATDYRYTHLRSTVGGSILEGGSAGGADIVLSSGVGNAAGEHVSGKITIFTPGAVQRLSLIYHMDGLDNGGNGFTVSGGGTRRTNADVDAFRLFYASGGTEGNLNAGKYYARYFS